MLAFHEGSPLRFLDWDDVIFFLDVPTISAAVLIGMLIGWRFFMAVSTFSNPAIEFLILLTAGLIFIFINMMSLFTSDDPTWDRGIGRAILWGIFCISIIIGGKLHEKRVIRKAKHQIGKENSHA